MPNPLITLNCPNCGGTLESAGQDTYVCSYCGAVHRLRDHPDWLKSLQENLDQLKAQLTDLQNNRRVAAAAHELPSLLLEREHLTQSMRVWARAGFVSLLVLGVGYFLNQHLVFSPGSSWIRFLPAGSMLLGGLALSYFMVRFILIMRTRAHLKQSIERCRDTIRNLGA